MGDKSFTGIVASIGAITFSIIKILTLFFICITIVLMVIGHIYIFSCDDFLSRIKQLSAIFTWPMIVLLIVLIFRRQLSKKIEQISHVKVDKSGNVEVDTTENIGPAAPDLGEGQIIPRFVIERGSETREKTAHDDIVKKLKEIDIAAAAENYKEAIDLSEQAIRLSADAKQPIPMPWKLFHNLSVFIIRLIIDGSGWGKIAATHDPSESEKLKSHYLQNGELYCNLAINSLLPRMPYGTLYNLARLQSVNGNLQGVAETFAFMTSHVEEVPRHLAEAIIKGERDFQSVSGLPEYIKMFKVFKDKYSNKD